MKKIVSILLAMSLIILSVITAPMFAGAAETPQQKTMLHVTRTSDSANKLALKIPSNTIKANTQYTVSFRSSFVTRALGNKVYFCLFGETSSDSKYADAFIIESTGKHANGKKFDTSVLDADLSTFTFTLDSVSDYSDFYLGFYLETTADFYIADFVLYESGDVNKTNLLPKNEYSNDMSGFYNDWNNGGDGNTPPIVYAASQYVPFDSERFPVLQKTMFHFKRTTSGNGKIAQKISAKLKAGVKYTLSFDYKFITNSINNNCCFCLFGETTADQNADKFLRVSGYFSATKFDNIKDNGTTYKCSFTLTQEEIDACTDFYAGFYYQSATPEFYLADMVLFETSDNLKTNLLSCGEYAANIVNSDSTKTINGWYTYYKKNGNDGWGDGYVVYNAEYFPEPQKTMLHFKRTSVGENQFEQKIAEPLKAGVEYTVSLDYKLIGVSWANTFSFNLFGDATPNSNPYANKIMRTTNYGSSASFPRFTTIEDDGFTLKCTFTLTDTEIQTYPGLYLGFYYASKMPEVYVANFVLYESSDASKTNLMFCDEYSNLLTGWYTLYAANGLDGWGEGYIPYNASYFKEAEASTKTLLHVNKTSTNSNRLANKLPANTLKAGTSYTASFKHNFVTSPLNDRTYFALFGETADTNGVYADKIIRISATDAAAHFDDVTVDANSAEYTFTLSEDEMSGCTAFYVGFYYVNDSAVEYYVGDLKLYETEDTTETDLISSVKYRANMRNWFNDYNNGGDGNNPPLTYAYGSYVQWGSSDANGDGNCNILDLINIKKQIAAVVFVPTADVNCDCVINAQDLTIVKTIILGGEDSFF